MTSQQQAGTGPSRRHIQGSKIAEGLQNVFFFTVLKDRKFFEKNYILKKIERVAR